MNLKEVAELSWEQIFPKGSDETSIPKESFIRTAYSEFAFLTWVAYLNEKNQEGYAETPSYLLTEVEKDVTNNEMDISDLKYFKSLPQEVWLQKIGEDGCKCKYIKSTINLSQLLCEDDSIDDAARTYYIRGKKIKFPKGVHRTPLQITYASMGEDSFGSIEVDEAISAQIREKLNSIYLGKVAPADVTNNSNPNN
jgi:hypothetical protein